MGGLKPRTIGAPNPVGMKQKPPRPAFMADGGMGGDPGQDADDMGDGVKIDPSAVHYHPDPQSCGTCEYMGEDGQCAILKIQVTPEGACSAYEGKEGGEGEEMMAPEGGEEEAGGPPAPGGRGMYGG